MKNEVLNSVKAQMGNVIAQMQLDNLEQTRTMIGSYLDFLNTLNALPVFEEPAPVVSPSSPGPTPVTVSNEHKEDNIYVFERKLRGGIFPDLQNGYMIPEKMVRDIGLHHGDKVRISDAMQINGETRYKFDIAEKANIGDAPGRVQFDYCIVESDGARFVVSKCAAGDILVDGVKQTFTIPQRDAHAFNVKEGDLIDVAFYENNLDSLRLVYRHDTPPPVEYTSTVTKKPAAKKSVANDETEVERKFPIDLDFMKSKHVVIVGSAYEKLKYQRMFDMLSINLTHMSGDEGKVRLRTVIKKADVVVVTTQHVGHKGSVPTAELCKEYNIPMAAVDRNGPQYILMEAERVMKRKIEQEAV